jgi:hypothetical protein
MAQLNSLQYILSLVQCILFRTVSKQYCLLDGGVFCLGALEKGAEPHFTAVIVNIIFFNFYAY